jgi:hypothetical protein
MDDLTLQVGLVDHIEVDDSQRPHAAAARYSKAGEPSPARTDTQHAGVLEPPLSGLADIGNDQVPGVAPDLIHGQIVSRGYQRGQ